MSATKEFYARYSENLDATWEAVEDAIIKIKALNDLLWTDDGEIVARSPRADVRLLGAKIKELQEEMTCFDSTKEPIGLPPILPGETRF